MFEANWLMGRLYIQRYITTITTMSLGTVGPEDGKIVEGELNVVDRWCEPCLCQGND